MNLYEYLPAIIIFLLTIPYGILVYYDKQKIVELLRISNIKVLSKLTFVHFILFIFPVIGLLFSMNALETEFNYVLIEDIAVGMLGVSGIIFTFMIGALLSNKSDLQKNLNEIDLQIILGIRNSGFDHLSDDETVRNKITGINKAMKKKDKSTREVLLWGLLTIFSFIVSLFGIMLLPVGEKSTGSNYFLIFEGIWFGFGALLFTFDRFDSSLRE